MTICINCGKENESCLCTKCRDEVNVENLCMKIIGYTQDSNENELWEKTMSDMSNPSHFKNIAFVLSDELPSPKKEYMKVMSLTGELTDINKNSRQWLYDVYGAVKDTDGLSALEKLRLDGIVLGALYMDYEYEKAEALAEQLRSSDDMPWQVCFNLAKFYMITRRYDIAKDIVIEAKARFADNDSAISKIEELIRDIDKYVTRANEGKQEYFPNPKDNKDEAIHRYVEFLASIGIEVEIPSSERSTRDVIPKDKYPVPVETRDADIDTFVAFDLETTGVNASYDSIVEIGAIKVVDGRIVDSEEFTFQELVKPLDHKKISPEAKAKSGLTDEEVNAARPIREVFPDFVKFAGNSVLLGFNCMGFDSKFMVRAGRYSNLIIENKYFDVMHYATQFSEKLALGRKFSLEDLSNRLNVTNPRAHRALADAITTAKVFLELRKMDDGTRTASVEDMLSDLDKW